ncbi:MAG: type IX secretion system outer membrane channel protein PorV [Bacteroidota bacterium]|nr:type IX secretion system outer membrane channel protein PorV [Bacteroidota bacterium]MDX5431604.1 type IX secretion system outer membrane channel protein PorV [Bacteroidota bacterium]MDX5470325.1 type IX secretion system outer membrane channel protein PorV [Bacteroidota bacterium]
MNLKNWIIALTALVSGASAYAQPNLLGQQNAITTTVPFLMISPDARGGAMGDVGAATPADPNSGHWNPAKFAFIEKPGGVSLTYTPWLRQLVDGVSISYLSAYGKINKRSTLAGSLRFFSLGNINYTDDKGNSIGTFNPSEYALDGFYSTQLSKHFSMGVGVRFIYSNLIGNLTSTTTRPGVAGAADLGMYYTNKKKLESKKMMDYAIGLAITNIGNKITYTSDAQRDFIPINLRLGGYAGVQVDDYNHVGIALDFNKLLVPTPPLFELDSDGQIVIGGGGPVVAYGKSNDVPVLEGMFQSFGDAPNGFKEEMQEVQISVGGEWWYQKQFAVRAGYFNEHKNKGNRKFMTFGIGVRYNVFGLDVSYLTGLGQRNPLQNTLRFSLLFDFAAFKSADSE